MPNEKITTADLMPPRGFYSHGVRNGRFVFISGQLPINRDGELVGKSAGEQAEQALGNVQAVLAAAGAGWEHLCQVTIYISDISEWPEVNAVYERRLRDLRVPPSRAIVPTKELHYGAHVEIQAIACLE
ncbi:MAG: RidA family protein [Terriglobales bacterium]